MYWLETLVLGKPGWLVTLGAPISGGTTEEEENKNNSDENKQGSVPHPRLPGQQLSLILCWNHETGGREGLKP